MKRYEKEPFKGGSIVIDGNEYVECSFDSVEIIYAGGSLPNLISNSFTNCRWTFDGPAARTIQLLRALYGGGGQALIEATFENIRGKEKTGIKLN